jgi:hypothetical protein
VWISACPRGCTACNRVGSRDSGDNSHDYWENANGIMEILHVDGSKGVCGASLSAAVRYAIEVLCRPACQAKFDVLGVRVRQHVLGVLAEKGWARDYRTESIGSTRTCALIIDVMLALTFSDSTTARSMMLFLLGSALLCTQPNTGRQAPTLARSY